MLEIGRWVIGNVLNDQDDSEMAELSSGVGLQVGKRFHLTAH